MKHPNPGAVISDKFPNSCIMKSECLFLAQFLFSDAEGPNLPTSLMSPSVLVLAGIEFIFFGVTGMGLCFDLC